VNTTDASDAPALLVLLLVICLSLRRLIGRYYRRLATSMAYEAYREISGTGGWCRGR